MLVLSRKVGERILVGDQIRITVVRLTSGGVRLGIEAPNGTTVIREELRLKLQDEAQSAPSQPDADATLAARTTGR
jgi:carbon storage regulator